MSLYELLIYDVHWCAVTRHFECWRPSSRSHTCTCKGNVWRHNVWKSLLFLDWNSHRDNRARPSTPGPGLGSSSSHLYQHLPRIYFAKCLKNINYKSFIYFLDYEYFFYAPIIHQWKSRSFRTHHNQRQTHNASYQHGGILDVFLFWRNYKHYKTRTFVPWYSNPTTSLH